MNFIPKKNQRLLTPFFPFIVLLEGLFLFAVLRSFSIGIFIFAVLFCFFILFLLPEMALGFALTGNVLLHVVFDDLQLNLMAPVILTYIVLIFSALFLHNIRNQGHAVKIKNKVASICFAMGFLLVIGLLYSTNKSYGAEKAVFYFLINIPLFLVPYWFSNPVVRFEHLLKAAFLLGIVLTFICFASPNAYTIMPGRFSPTESVNPIFLARSLGLSALCGLFLLAATDRRMAKIFILAAIVFMIPPMVWTKSRGPLLGLFLIGLLYYFFQPNVRLWKKLTAIGFGITAGIYVIIRFATGIASRLTIETVAEEGSTIFRLLSWLQATQDFFSSPLTGIGTGSFFLETPWAPILYPHNLVLEFASENGIIGLILILSFIFFTILIGFTNIQFFGSRMDSKRVQLSVGLLCLFLYALWNSMFSGDVFKNEIVWLSSGMITSIHFGLSSQEREFL